MDPVGRSEVTNFSFEAVVGKSPEEESTSNIGDQSIWPSHSEESLDPTKQLNTTYPIEDLVGGGKSLIENAVAFLNEHSNILALSISMPNPEQPEGSSESEEATIDIISRKLIQRLNELAEADSITLETLYDRFQITFGEGDESETISDVWILPLVVWSEFFRALIFSGFKESITKEINFPTVTKQAFQALFAFAESDDTALLRAQSDLSTDEGWYAAVSLLETVKFFGVDSIMPILDSFWDDQLPEDIQSDLDNPHSEFWMLLDHWEVFSLPAIEKWLRRQSRAVVVWVELHREQMAAGDGDVLQMFHRIERFLPIYTIAGFFSMLPQTIQKHWIEKINNGEIKLYQIGLRSIDKVIRFLEENCRYSIETLDLSKYGATIGNHHISWLVEHCPDLKKLVIGSSEVTDEIGPDLVKMKGLTNLDLTACGKLTDKIGAYLVQMKGLTHLCLQNCWQFTDEIMVYLNQMKELDRLSIGGCNLLTNDARFIF